jgi:hypothetical protein
MHDPFHIRPVTVTGSWLPFFGGVAFGTLMNLSDGMYRRMTPRDAQAWWRDSLRLHSRPTVISGGWFWPALGGYALSKFGDVLYRDTIAAKAEGHL